MLLSCFMFVCRTLLHIENNTAFDCFSRFELCMYCLLSLIRLFIHYCSNCFWVQVSSFFGPRPAPSAPRSQGWDRAGPGQGKPGSVPYYQRYVRCHPILGGSACGAYRFSEKAPGPCPNSQNLKSKCYLLCLLCLCLLCICFDYFVVCFDYLIQKEMCHSAT